MISKKEITNKRLFVYWDGEVPAYIDVMIDIMRRQYYDYNLEVINMENIENYLDSNKVMLYRKMNVHLRAAQMSDIVSSSLLSEHGGIFLDADVLVYRRPFFMEEKLDDYEFVGIGSDHPGYGMRIPVWVMMSQKGAKIIRRWEEKNIQKIRQFFRFLWTDPVLLYLNVINTVTRNKRFLMKNYFETPFSLWKYSQKKEKIGLKFLSKLLSDRVISNCNYENIEISCNGLVNPYYYLDWEAYGCPILSKCVSELWMNSPGSACIFDEMSSNFSFRIVDQFKANPSLPDVLQFFLDQRLGVYEIENRVPLTILQFNNAYTGEYLKTRTREEFLSMPWLISRLANNTLERLSKDGR